MKNPLQVKDYYSDDPDERQESADANRQPQDAPTATPTPARGANITFDLDDAHTGSNAASSGAGGDDNSGRKHRHGCRKALIWVVSIAVVALGLTFYLRYFNPYATDARLTGCVLSVEKRGMIFKTYEAEIVTRDALTDTTHVYTRERSMTVASEAVARRLQALQGTGRPVTVSYERFYGTLPWRGSSTSVITAIVAEPAN